MRNKLVLVVALLIPILQGCCIQAIRKQKEIDMTEPEKIEKETPKIDVKFIYSLCNDIDAMRHFYTDLLGMKEIAYYNDAEQKFGYL
jgi:hypothetical protein